MNNNYVFLLSQIKCITTGGYWGAAESMNKPDGVDNQKYTFGDGGKLFYYTNISALKSVFRKGGI